MKIYGDMRSGNCYKLKLVCELLSLDYQWLDVDILAGEAATPEFKQKNPNAKIPLLELDDGRILSESNAIINYLAAGTSFIPTDNYQLALVQQWQFFEQYSHEPFIAVARFIAKFLGLPDDRRGDYESKQAGGHKALSIMEMQLSKTSLLIGEQMTTADIALYAYTHVAHEGGFELEGYPAITDWLTRIEAQPGYVPMV